MWGIVLIAVISFCAAQDVLLSMPITIDGVDRELLLRQGESVENAALQFAEKAGISNSPDAAEIVGKLSQMLTERLQQVASEQKEKIFSVELQVDGQATILEMVQGQTKDDVLTKYFTKYNIPQHNHANLIPQLESVIQQQVQNYLAQFQEQPRLLFTLPLNLAGERFEINHFEGYDPMQEARAFCNQNQIRPELVEDLVPQIAQLIQQQMDAMSAPPLPLEAVFTIPVSINHQEFDLVHYKNHTPLESVQRFLHERGVTEPNAQQEYVPHLLPLIEQQLQSQTVPETPVFSIPLILGKTEAQLNYFSSQTPEESATSFVRSQGLMNDPEFQNMVAQISNLIRQELQAREVPQEPLFTLPITLNQTAHELNYYAQQEPSAAALAFCKSKMHFISTSTDETIRLAQLNECVTFLAQTIESVLVKVHQEAQRPKMFTLDVHVDGQAVQMPFYEGHDPVQVAQNFCQEHNLPMDNVEPLAESIRSKLQAN